MVPVNNLYSVQLCCQSKKKKNRCQPYSLTPSFNLHAILSHRVVFHLVEYGLLVDLPLIACTALALCMVPNRGGITSNKKQTHIPWNSNGTNML